MSARVFTIANQKGGVGKTTSVINLGTALALAGKRILLVDLDPQANLTSGVGRKGETAAAGTVYQALTTDVEDASAFILDTRVETMWLIPADRNLTGAEVELVSLPHREHRLRAFLEPLRDRYDYIVIDAAPVLGYPDTPLLANVADGVLLVVAADATPLEASLAARREIERSGACLLGAVVTKQRRFVPGFIARRLGEN